MTDYQKTKIYKIESHLGDNIYVGSTCKEYLSQRFQQHKTDYKRWKDGKTYNITSFKLFEEYGIENCNIILIEAYPCNSKDEKNAREGHYIKELNCVNKNIMGRSKKEYQQDNKVNIAERKKKYNIENKEKIADKRKKFYEENKERLLKEKKEYDDNNKEKRAEKDKKYYENNKEKIIERARQYREANKTKILEQKKKHYKDKKEKISISEC